jgi:hypothetical protein
METLPPGLAEVVEDAEDLAGYLTSSSQFTAVMVKPAAFLPNPRDGETSVFRHGREPRGTLWRIARDYALGERTLHGAAIFKARHVRAALLDVVASEPPPRHAAIVGWAWSASDPELGKAERKERAALIAQHADLVRP